ncbi:Mov34/MPN/PAD-1 family protein [Paenibacillus aurantius]|uniref:Mov34/MPN/PAD-1 family protein n=1 Tax=Paenibacillus aurantius TaxID=2918900 RepID=A0AA96LCM0_9BACL|nr:Mov34/MPN/PAD-1 family protein [Paenibacillus aurantius]WNQ09646.1 Mov34/MPN/PAD-1 family protein [Paenibacillus aurantius]
MLPIKKIIIPELLTKETVRALLSFHPSPFKNHEGILYWGGYDFNDTVIVATCVVPKATSGPQEVHTTPEANAEVISYLNKHGMTLIAQVHSHPKDLKRHSAGDDKFTFMPYDGYFSVVVPFYARKAMSPLTMCGFHMYHRGKFHVMPDNWTMQNVKMIPGYVDLRGNKNGLTHFK